MRQWTDRDRQYLQSAYMAAKALGARPFTPTLALFHTEAAKAFLEIYPKASTRFPHLIDQRGEGMILAMESAAIVLNAFKQEIFNYERAFSKIPYRQYPKVSPVILDGEYDVAIKQGPMTYDVPLSIETLSNLDAASLGLSIGSQEVRRAWAMVSYLSGEKITPVGVKDATALMALESLLARKGMGEQ